MRPVTLNVHDVTEALREIERASHEAETVEIANNFSITGTLTPTYALNLTSPSAANVAAVLGTLLDLLKKGGLTRTT